MPLLKTQTMPVQNLFRYISFQIQSQAKAFFYLIVRNSITMYSNCFYLAGKTKIFLHPKAKRRPPKATKVRFESFCKRVQKGQQKHSSTAVVCLHNLLSGHKTCLFGLLRLLPNASFFNFRTKLVYQLGCPDNFVSICFISHLTVSNLACNQSFFFGQPL